jgi:hypothetical protein
MVELRQLRMPVRGLMFRLGVMMERVMRRVVLAARGRRLMLRMVFVACHALAGAPRTARCASLADVISVEPLAPTRRKWQLRH